MITEYVFGSTQRRMGGQRNYSRDKDTQVYFTFYFYLFYSILFAEHSFNLYRIDSVCTV